YKEKAQVDSLSRGMQQRLGLARVLLHDPEVLILDEPASGLDPHTRVEIRELLKELRNMGKTILISSHILSELTELCNKVKIIERGQLLFSGPTEDLLKRVRRVGVIQIKVREGDDRACAALASMAKIKKASIADGMIEVELKAGHEDHSFLAQTLV